MALTKANMAENLFEELGLNKREAKELVEVFFEEVRLALEEGEEVVTGPYSLVSKTLRDGNELKKTDRKDLFKED